MNKYILYINEENRILEYMLPGEDNRQGTLDLQDELSVPDLIFSYEVWDGEWYIKSNDYLRLSIEHMVQDYIQIQDGVLFNIKVRSSGKRLTCVAHLISGGMTSFEKFDIQGLSSLSIGSSPECSICIKQNFISHCHAVLFYSGNGWYIEDQSRNGTFLNSERISGRQKLNIGDSIYIIGYKIIFLGKFIAVNRIEDIDVHLNPFEIDRVADTKVYQDASVFSRAPRFIEPLDDSEVELEAPPQKEKQRKTPLWLTLGPSLTMPLPILMTVIVNSAMSKSSGRGGGMYLGMLVSVVMFAILGVMWSILRTRNDKKTREESELQRVNAYSAYINQNDNYLNEKLEHNKKVLLNKYKSSAELARTIPQNNITLWDRNINHEDFLTIRLGEGFIKSPVLVKAPKQKFSVDQDSLAEYPQKISQKYEYISDAVKTINLVENKIIGVIGAYSDIDKLVRNMVIQVAALHSYTDVKMAFLFDEHYDMEWVRWLPHVFSNDKKNRYVGTDNSSIQNVIYALTNELRLRDEKLKEDGEKAKFTDRYIVFCTDKSYFENEAIYKYLVSEEDYGFTFVLMYGTVNYLPNECNLIIERSSNYNGIYVLNEAYDGTRDIRYDDISVKDAEAFARYMSGYCVSEMLEGQIPDSIEYFDMLGIKKLEDWDLIKNYKQNRSYEGLPSLVGVQAGGKPLYLDIHEKKYGPHGLVAGTTGSGKSETIQTFILSLIMNYSPDEVAFILIDYKGGGMANVFLGLPHVAGAITNLGTGDNDDGESVDPNQMRRALISIRSEIKRRQALFNKYKVNHIDLYMRLYRDHKAEEPLPHLIIISDEFAELKKEQPEFIKELVSTARVGRSLGIHLILATQKPAGVVDDEIWSNSRFKICLRVQDKQDSQGMLKRPEAAYLTQTGRAYLQIGNDEIFEMFQSGYSGAPYDPKEDDGSTADAVDMIGIDGHSLIVKQTKSKSSDNETKITQLEAGIKYITEMSEQYGYSKTRPLWLPALSDHVYLDDVLSSYQVDRSVGLNAVLGLVDEPEKQNIKPLVIDMNSISNMLIVGINSSGKTTMIKTLIMSLIECYTAAQVQFYILDFSSRTLKTFRNLPHVGDVFYPEETEGVTRTLQFAFDEIARRTAIFQKSGIGGFNEYNESNQDNPLPCMIFIIDNIYDFLAEYQNQEDAILKLTRDGSRYGIQFVASANRASDMRYKMRQNFTCMIPLRLVEKADYLDILGKTPSFIPSSIAGRGLVLLDDILEFQTALPVVGNTEADRNAYLKKVIEAYKSGNHGPKAHHIPILPKDSTYEEILDNQATEMIEAGEMPIGYDIDKIELLGINDVNTYSYTVWGTSRGQVSTVIGNLLLAAEKIATDIYFINNDSGMEYLTTGRGYTVCRGYEGIYDLLKLLKNEFKDRNARRKELSEQGVVDPASVIVQEFGRKLVVIDDLVECTEIVYDEDNEEKLFPIFELFMKQGAKLGIQFISGVSGEMPVRVLSQKLVKTMFEYKTGICMGGLLNSQKLFSFDLPLNQQVKKQPDNVGYTVIDNKVVKVYVPETKK
ncbi:MAG: type VII secretion protein EssC [Eubacterium sp.]|nr:type VII secretion protein EssC [Eubacterium sp.]